MAPGPELYTLMLRTMSESAEHVSKSSGVYHQELVTQSLDVQNPVLSQQLFRLSLSKGRTTDRTRSHLDRRHVAVPGLDGIE